MITEQDDKQLIIMPRYFHVLPLYTDTCTCQNCQKIPELIIKKSG